MLSFAIIRFFLECTVAALICYAIYREKDLIKFERKVWKYTKAFFKAVYYTLKDKFAPVKETRPIERYVNEEYDEILESLDKRTVAVIDFKIAS